MRPYTQPHLKATRNLSAYFLALSVAFLLGRPVFADNMASTSFKIESDTLSLGGGNAASTGFIVEDTIGEIASGEDLTSTSYKACAEFQCTLGEEEEKFLTFSVTSGAARPGTAGGTVAIGTLLTSTVSDATNSIYLDAETNADSGVTVTVKGANAGLARASYPTAKINAFTGTLAAGSEGYGICVTEATEDGASQTTYDPQNPYNGTCVRTSGHAVGTVDGTWRNVLASSGELLNGQAEVLVKASISVLTEAGNDFTDTLTFVATATY